VMCGAPVPRPTLVGAMKVGSWFLTVRAASMPAEEADRRLAEAARYLCVGEVAPEKPTQRVTVGRI
jgi:hypothetical protein